MATELALPDDENKPKHPVPALFEHLGLGSVKTKDEFTVVYKNGILEANVKRTSGLVQTATRHVKGGGFRTMTEFDPLLMPKDERDMLIKYKHSKGETQVALAKTFGLSQARVSKIVNE